MPATPATSRANWTTWVRATAWSPPAAEKSVPALVEAMNGCVQQSLEELTRSLGDAVATLQSKQETGQ